jgi:hypothetical protein
MKAKVGLGLNVTYELRDKFGDIKPLFQENKFFRFLLNKRLLSPKSFKIPYLFGAWSNQKVVANLVTNAGKASCAGLLTGDVVNYFDYIAVGTGTTAAAVTDTALETETATSGLSRAASTNSRVTTDVTNDTAQFTKTFSVSGTVAVTESGVLDASSTGTLLARQTFSAINVVNGDSLTITWKIDVD